MQVSGTKKELVARIKLCLADGCLPRCPSCGGGKLKAIGGGMLKCPGYHDDDHFRNCGYKEKSGTTARPAWQTEAGQLI